MSSGWRLLLIVLAGVLFCVPMFYAEAQDAEELCIPVGTITLAAPDGVEAKRAPVDFPHSQHFAINCMECHHEWDGGTEYLSCSTSGCHDVIEPPSKADPDDAALYFKTAFHKSCIGCHKAIKAENKKRAQSMLSPVKELLPVGPTGCVECHPRD